MKTTKKSTQKSAASAPAKTVKFSLNCGGAKKVAVAGTFNQWNAENTPLNFDGSQCWEQELALPPGAHEYQFVVDGQWMPDPKAQECIPNPYGGVNSVIRVASNA
jgi:1,4-alpha-glucan branching enzyme